MEDVSIENAKPKGDSSSFSMQVKTKTPLSGACTLILSSNGSLPTVSSNQVNSVLLALDHNQHIDSQLQVIQADQSIEPGETVKLCSKGNKAMLKNLKILREKESGDQMEERHEETDELRKWMTIKSMSSESESLTSERELEVLFMEDSPEAAAVACHSYSKNSKRGLPKQQKGKNLDCKQTNEKSLPKRRKSQTSGFGNKTDNGIEQVACYKCKYCPYLSLRQDAVASHVKQDHASQIPKETNGGMQCPGCDNIFYSVNSLRVHLSEDHNVAPGELENIISTFNLISSGENAVSVDDETPSHEINIEEEPSGASEIVEDTSSTGTALNQSKNSIKLLKDQRVVSANDLQSNSQVIITKNPDKRKVVRLTPSSLFSKDEMGKIRVRKMSSLEKSKHGYTKDELENVGMESSPSISTFVSQENSSVALGTHAGQKNVDDNSKEVDSKSVPCNLETVQILEMPLDQQPDESDEHYIEELNDDSRGALQTMIVDSDGKYCTVTASPSSCEAILDEICQEEVLENVLYVQGSDLLDHDPPLMVCFAASPSDLADHVNYCDVEMEDNSVDSERKNEREGNASQRMILSSCEIDGTDLMCPGGKRLVKRGFVKRVPVKKSTGKKECARKKSRKKESVAEDPSAVGYRCNLFGCPFRFQSQENLIYHQNCHVSCAFSEDSFSQTLSEITSEQERKLLVPKKKRLYTKFMFSCPECFIQYDTWKQMRGHLWKVHSIDMEMYSCSQCDYKSTSLSELKNVHERIHGSEKPFLCDICGKGFKTTKQLRNHKYLHERALDRLQTCEVCGRSFHTVRMLQSHIDTVHNKVRPYMCSACGHTAANRSSLKIHLRQHTGDRPYSCDQCEYSTPDHNSLRRHKKRHSGDKPYKCPYCPYACIQSTTFKIHVRSKHPGQDVDLVFSCEKCSFHSVSHDIYLAHIAEHDLEKTTGIPFRQVSRGSKKGRASKISKCIDEPFDDVPIFVSIATNEADEESPQPNFENIVQHVSEAIVPGSNLHVLYNSIPESSSKAQSSMDETNTDDTGTVCSAIQSAEEESERELVH